MTTVPDVQEKNMVISSAAPQPATEGTTRPVDPGDIDLGDTQPVDITSFLSGGSTNLHKIEA